MLPANAQSYCHAVLAAFVSYRSIGLSAPVALALARAYVLSINS